MGQRVLYVCECLKWQPSSTVFWSWTVCWGHVAAIRLIGDSAALSCGLRAFKSETFPVAGVAFGIAPMVVSLYSGLRGDGVGCINRVQSVIITGVC